MTTFTLTLTDPETEEEKHLSVRDVLNTDKDWSQLITELLDPAEISAERLDEATTLLHNLRSKVEAQTSTKHTTTQNKLHRLKVLEVIDWSLSLVSERRGDEHRIAGAYANGYTAEEIVRFGYSKELVAEVLGAETDNN